MTMTNVHEKFIGQYGFLTHDSDSFIFTTILGQQFGHLDGIKIMFETDYGVWIDASNGVEYRFDDAYCCTVVDCTVVEKEKRARVFNKVLY